MELTDILVHIDHFASSASRLDVAVGLAKRHHARLTGLLVIRHQYPTEAVVLAAKKRFERRMDGAGIEGRWQCVDGSLIGVGMTDIVLAHARCSDLLIIGQGSPKSASVGVPFDLPERVVLESGRPVLVVPYTGSFVSVGDRVLVSWKAGPESTRAVNDALPILKLAQRVEVLEKNRPGSYPEDGEHTSLSAYLARHEVTAKVGQLLAGDTPWGDVLLNRVCDDSFDLLVMGASARGLEGKVALGSVARQLLREMTVPVLMSH